MSKARILIVEDEFITGKNIKKLLESLGYVVTSLVVSGEKAIKEAEKDRPDLILMDILLKGEMDGIEAAEIVKSKHDLPVIYITAYSDEEFIKRAQITEPFAYLIKPLQERELHIAIEMALYKHKAEKERKVYRDNLEHLVEERTAELIRINKEQKKLGEQLRHAQKMEAIGTLANGIAHDFNNLLHSIMGFANLLKKRLKDKSKERRFAENIITASKRGGNLTERLLTFSRMNEGKKKNVDFKGIVEETLEIIKSTIPSTIRVASNIDLDKPCYIFADSSQAHQVVMNLCVNAAQAMPEGGRLKVDLKIVDKKDKKCDINKNCEIHPPYIRLVVTDSGMGIEKSIQSRIYDPFFTTKPESKGSGLGLSIVYGVVKNNSGNISFSSEPGKGSEFCICFPMVNITGEANLSKLKIKTPIDSVRTLFVDDEQLVVEMAEDSLRGLGFVVTSFTNSAKAFEAFSKEPGQFDIVITDQTMPGMTGMELSKKIKSLRKDIPVLLCTGYGQLVTKDQCESAGVSELLKKPLSVESLALSVRKVLQLK